MQYKQEGKLEPTDEDEEDDDLDPEDRIKLMLEQFNYIYQNDAALRKLLGNEVQNYSVEEKLEILRAYMEGGGVQGLVDNEDEFAALDIDPEEEKMINEQFDEIYKSDPKLRQLLGDNVTSLGAHEKK